MPPRASFTSSFSASDANNEVVCPLRNHDGSNCRKRCLGVSSLQVLPERPHVVKSEPMLTNHRIQEKRYRSMQEHIRRAHPEHYIPKLPATEESFQRMINSPPSERPPPPPPSHSFGNTGKSATGPESWTELMSIVYGHDRDAYSGVQSSSAPPRTIEDQYPAAATAAVALAQLHNHRPDSDWESEAVCLS